MTTDPKQQTVATDNGAELHAEELGKISGGFAGINALIAVTQMKVDNAKSAAD